MFPYPILVCDIGGTNARFGYASAAGEPLHTIAPMGTAEFGGLADACRAAVPGSGTAPASLIVCAAGPVKGKSVELTNISWRINGPDIAAELDLKQGLLLNDFEALALTLPVLDVQDLRPIGLAGPAGSQAELRLILGPGTGLGVAALLSADGYHHALASEAGHMELAPADGAEAELFAHVETPQGRLSAETLISGPGLVRLHRARGRHKGAASSQSALNPAEITRLALRDPLGPEADSIRHFWRLTARFAGDMALAFAARGGVTLAGGILPKLTDFLDEKEFRNVFEHKAPMGRLAAAISTRLLLNDQAALRGMRAIADAPHKYRIDFEKRCWL